MAKYKTEFEITDADEKQRKGEVSIIGGHPTGRPYVIIEQDLGEMRLSAFIKDKDLERFAVNILKSLNSKHLK